jgi:hypothetical protein
MIIPVLFSHQRASCVTAIICFNSVHLRISHPFFFSKMHLNNFAIALFTGLALAHPGEEHHHDRAVELSKREFKAAARRGLSACSEKLHKRDGMMDRAAMRRAATVAKYRKQLAARDTDTVLNTTHLSSSDYSLDTPDTTIFASNKTCVLSPEGETGPYWVKGEYIRNNLRDDQPGVPIVIEAQFVDVETCEPIKDLYW